MCRAASPLLPLLTEEIYLGLENGGKYEAASSVHLASFPDVSMIVANDKLVSDMDRVREIVTSALSIRNDENLRVRMPLSSLKVVGSNIMHLQDFAELIKEEVNVKQIEFSESIVDYASFKPQVNFPILGKRLPAKMKDIIAGVKAGNWQRSDDGKIIIAGEKMLPEECSVLLEPKEKKATHSLSSQDALVVLDLNVTEELKSEGIARDLVRFIQQARKDANLNVSDRIILALDASSEVINASNNFKNYIAEQTLAEISEPDASNQFEYKKEGELEGEKVSISFSVK
jgi:isoleucyl-tRNA synthetase